MKFALYTAGIWVVAFTAFLVYYSPRAIVYRARNRGVAIPTERKMR